MKRNSLTIFLSSAANCTINYSRITILLLLIILASVSKGFAARTSALSEPTPTIAATICAPATNVVIFSFADAEGSTVTTISAINFATTGTAIWGTDVTNFSIWSNTTNTFAGATLLGTIIGTSGTATSGAHTLSYSASLTKSATTFYFISATVASTATNARTITVSAMAHAAGVPFTFSGTTPSYSGSAAAGGAQTIGVVAALTGGTSALCGAPGTTTTFLDATPAGVWTSSTTTVATVLGGIAKGVASGITTISYTVGSCSATASLAYATATPAAISGPSSICPLVPTVLLSESFENSFPPSGWGNTGTSGLWFQQYGAGSYDPSCGIAEDGNYVAEMNFFDFSSGTSLLYTSPISLVNTSGVVLSFWVYRDDGYDPYSCGFTTEGVTIGVNTSPIAGGATNLGFIPRSYTGPTTGSLVGVSVPSAPGWYQYTANIPGTYTGATNYILFSAKTQFGENMYLDNVVVTGNVASTTTLSDATAGGTWMSTNTTVATVGALTGVVTGFAIGTSTISYTNACGGVAKTMYVLGPITGITNVCPSLTTALSDGMPGGAWTSSTTTVATVGPGTGLVLGLTAGTTSITYSIDAGCRLNVPLTVNPAPAIISGGAGFMYYSTHNLFRRIGGRNMGEQQYGYSDDRP